MIKERLTVTARLFGAALLLDHGPQGRIIQSPVEDSVLGERRKMAVDPEFSACVVSDIGGRRPICISAMHPSPEVEDKCKHFHASSTICKLCWAPDHGTLLELLRRAAEGAGNSQAYWWPAALGMDLCPVVARLPARVGGVPRRVGI